MKKKCVLILCALVSCWNFLSGQNSKQSLPRPDSVLQIMNKVAGWQIAAYNTRQVVSTKNGWESAAFYTGLTALMDACNKKERIRYDRFLMGIGNEFQWDTGPNRYFADDYCIAQMYSYMFKKHRASKMIAKWKRLADSIVASKFAESLKIAPGITHREWAWCDALYMGPPGLAMLSSITGNKDYLRKADSLWWKTTAYLYDTTDSLFYRDSRFFMQKEKNGQKIFWSRGNGWVMAATAHMLEYMPAHFINRGRYEQLLQEMSRRIIALQQPDGSWHASLLDPLSYSEKETSGTGFICYALAWGINNNLLDKKTYLPVVLRAWTAMKTAVHPDGKLGFVQNVGSGPIATNYESTYVYGVGAFLLAGTEIIKLVD